VLLSLGLPKSGFGQETAKGSPMSMADMVKQATQQSAPEHRIEALANGRARVPSPIQTIEAMVAPEGITVTSTAKDKPGSFAIRAASLGRIGSRLAPVHPGIVSADKDLARIVHPELSEELTTTAEGVRQDFVIPAAPQGSGDLALELSFSDIALKLTGKGIELNLAGVRKLLYHSLHVIDITGKTLPAHFEQLDSNCLRIVVADSGATYPLRIDPTITDANWVSIALPDTNGQVNTLLYAGGTLYAGGNFTAIGGTPANDIAKWDGTTWSSLGSGMNDVVAALAWDGTNLYAGGSFSTAGGTSANNIAKWNGTAWFPLGSGTGGIFSGVSALVWGGTNLYAGGSFTTAGGNSANYIAKWDGTTWSPLGSGMGGTEASVIALAWDGTNLYAGGWFNSAGGNTANNIAKWDGTAWSPLGSGMDGAVLALAWGGTNLYAGGWFTTAGGVSSSSIAKWNGSAWFPLGGGIVGGVYSSTTNSSTTNPRVNALAWDGANLYAGGQFSTAGGNSANLIAKWDGNTWSPLGSWTIDGTTFLPSVIALASDGTNLYAGGAFAYAGGVNANCVAKWNGSVWSPMGGGMGGYSGGEYVLAWDGTNLYAGGTFTTAGGNNASRIAKWNGSAWSSLGSGIDYQVLALASDGTNLYAGGWFTTAGGTSANNIAKWNGSVWSPLGSGMGSGMGGTEASVAALAWDGTNLYVGGNFTTAGGTSAYNIAKWNGTTWSPLGSGMNGTVAALAWDGTNLYAGGSFTTAGGINANNIAKWNGSVWSPLGSGISGGGINALTWGGMNLYAGGNFTTAGGNSANYIAKWDGNTWSPLGSGLNYWVYALAWDGTNVYAGGSFTTAGGNSANYIAMWNGSVWSPMGSGTNQLVYALAWDGTNLYAAGGFTTAGGKAAAVAYVTNTPNTSVPSAPTNVTASAGNGQATVSFTAPASNGGPEITSYTVTSSPGNITATSTSSPITVTGLTNGIAYTFTVTATNVVGTGLPSAASNSVTPATLSTVPGTPTGVSATAGNGQAIVTFTAPGSNGGSAIIGYTVTSSPGNHVVTGGGSPITVTGLTNGTAYTFTVTATNGVGTGPASISSNSVTPVVPASPVSGTCGSSNGMTFFVAPASSFCATGYASSVSGSGPWNWNCAGANGGTTAFCTAPKAAPPTIPVPIVTPPTINFAGAKTGTTFTILRSAGGGSFIQVTSGQSTIFTDTSTLMPNTIYIYVVTSDSDPTQTTIMTIRTPLYNGWNIVAVPYQTTGINPSTFFGSPVSAIYQWIPSGATPESSNSVLGSYTTVSTFSPGDGYFVKASNSSTLLTYSGTAGPFSATVTLKPGWTMIANPTTTNKTNIGTAWMIDGSTQLSTAISSGKVGSSLYWWNGTTYDFWTVASNPQVEPWKAYWILNLDSINHNLTIQ
jgi:hypothetical protein